MSEVFDFAKVNIDSKLETPIYLQIANQIIELIQNNQSIILTEKMQLPSVRAYSDLLNVARGTIQQSYNYLENEGYIYRVTGKGSFIKSREIEDISRKDKAIKAMDNMLKILDELGFTDREIQIYFDLKMRERDNSVDNLKVGIVEASSEIRTILQNTLSGISNIETYRYPIDELAFSGDMLLDNMDVILTTTANYQRLMALLKSYEINIDVIAIGLACDEKTVLASANVDPEKQIGILANTNHFADQMKERVISYINPEKEPIIHLLNAEDIQKFFDKVDVIFLANSLVYLSSEQIINQLQKFKKYKGEIIDFHYVPESGSLHYLYEKIDEKKQKIKHMQTNGGIEN